MTVNIVRIVLVGMIVVLGICAMFADNGEDRE